MPEAVGARMRVFVLALLVFLGSAVSIPVGGSTVDEGPSIRGRVADGESAVAGAWVELTPLVGRWQLGDLFFQGKTRPSPTRRAVTRADGTFVLRAPDVGMWRLTVGGEGFVPSQLSLVPLYRDVELPDVVLDTDLGLTIRVVGPQGAPLAKAAVLAYSSGTSSRRPDGLPAPTWRRATELAFSDENGKVHLHGRRGETLRLQIAEPDHPSASVEVELPVVGEEVPLVRGRRVTLRARDASDAPIRDALVWVDEMPFPVGWTGQDGLTSVVLPTKDSVSLRGLTNSGASAAFRMTTRSPVESIRLPFDTPRSVSGRVLRRGSQEGVAGALVWSWYRPDRFVRADAEGWFRLEAVDPSAYISAIRHGYRRGGRRFDEGPGGAPAVLQLQAVGRLEGLVVDDNGDPIPGLGLQPQSRGLTWEGESWPFRSGSDGSFVLTDLPAETELSVTLGGLDAMATRWAVVVRELPALAPGEERTGVLLEAVRGLTALGSVVDEADVPVVGAQVRLRDSDPGRGVSSLPPAAARETRSNESGNWMMTALPRGVYDLEVRASGFAAAVVPGLEVGTEIEAEGTPDTADLGTVILVPGVSLEGAVFDAGRQPLAGADVRAHETGRPDLASSTATDDDGRFVLRDLRGGSRIDLSAEHPDYLPGHAGPITVPREGDSLEEPVIVLKRGTSVQGRVADGTGRPVARAGVALFAQGGGGSALGGQSTTTTDREGRFELHRVPDGPATLQVSHRHFPTHSEPLQILPAHLGGTLVDVVLRGAAGSLRGIVRDIEGEPVGTALVLLPGDGVIRPASTHTDAEGGFELPGIDPGRREILVHHASFASYRGEVEVASSSWLDVQLQRGVTASGRVSRADGASIERARVSSTPLDDEGQATREGAISAADGSWTIERLVPGRYRFHAAAPGFYSPSEAEPLVVDRDVHGIEIELLRGVTLEGTVTGVAFDDLPRVVIQAQRIHSEFPTQPQPNARAEIDFQGAFRLEGLSPGSWRVSALLHPEGGRRSVDVEISDLGPPEPIVLRLGDGYDVSGTLEIVGARPGESTGIRLMLMGTSLTGHRMTMADPDGRFVFRDVEPGVYNLVAAGNAGQLWSRQLEVRDDVDVTIRARVASLTGTVRDRFGRALGDVRLRLSRRDVDGSIYGFAISTGADGRFRFVAVPSGVYRLDVVRDGFEPADQLVDLVEGLTTELEIVMDPLLESMPTER
ncbi:MAG: carboxypeptidase-like regulatory domain-containing protein [Thermoanaerobaculia bacterium]|nr:carboxypeptidase-like regulatory domain-containing protein [Thermoanaerobaculia bacterium]